ncbi:MAG: multidrug ABC transporter ATP-binding protein, partial [Planococcaceae bacterium]|nr:multidrug ABC transporter ATP-binding protein [Planococcaceae bacterium]
IIQQSLTELAENRTTLIIAHRLATIRNADRVIVVTKEGIVEDGSYSDLVEADGIFARLHNIQFEQI